MAFDGKSEHYCMNGMEAIDVIEAYKRMARCVGTFGGIK